MTHDELLAKILETGASALQSSTLGGGWIYDAKTNALRAVVELPMETKAKGMLMTAPANATLPELASLFYQQGYATAMNLVIQAIEKELK